MTMMAVAIGSGGLEISRVLESTDNSHSGDCRTHGSVVGLSWVPSRQSDDRCCGSKHGS